MKFSVTLFCSRCAHIVCIVCIILKSNVGNARSTESKIQHEQKSNTTEAFQVEMEVEALAADFRKRRLRLPLYAVRMYIQF